MDSIQGRTARIVHLDLDRVPLVVGPIGDDEAEDEVRVTRPRRPEEVPEGGSTLSRSTIECSQKRCAPSLSGPPRSPERSIAISSTWRGPRTTGSRRQRHGLRKRY